MKKKKTFYSQFTANVEKQLSQLNTQDLQKEQKRARRVSAWWLITAGMLMIAACSYFDPHLTNEEIWNGAKLGFGSNVSSVLSLVMLGTAVYVFWTKPPRHRVVTISLVLAACAAIPLFAVPTQTASSSVVTTFALLAGSIVACLLSALMAYRAEVVEAYKPKTSK